MGKCLAIVMAFMFVGVAAKEELVLKTKPREICEHFIELVKNGEKEKCLKYVHEESQKMFGESFEAFKKELLKMKKITFVEVKDIDDDHCGVYFQFGKHKDDFRMERVKGIWKIKNL
jgi:hypothetical protein